MNLSEWIISRRGGLLIVTVLLLFIIDYIPPSSVKILFGMKYLVPKFAIFGKRDTPVYKSSQGNSGVLGSTPGLASYFRFSFR